MHVKALAKINLCLEVLGVRPDGYHDVATVMHTIDLADELIVEASDGLSLHCDPPVGPTDTNLVLRAALLLQHETGCTLGAAMRLEKRIPVAAGLGGGSTDAAAALKALNALWGLALPPERLGALAAGLGSDVPFFLEGGCALAEGRGEALMALPTLTGWWAVLVCPPFALEGKTGRLYGMLTPANYSDGSAARRLAESIRAGAFSQEAFATVGNAFEGVAEAVFPGLGQYRQAFLEAGAPFVRLTGSGPALFTLVERQSEGNQLRERLRGKGYVAYLAALV